MPWGRMRASYLGEAAGESFPGLSGWYRTLMHSPVCSDDFRAGLLRFPSLSHCCEPWITLRPPPFRQHVNGENIRTHLVGLLQGLDASRMFRKVPWWGLCECQQLFFSSFT